MVERKRFVSRLTASKKQSDARLVAGDVDGVLENLGNVIQVRVQTDCAIAEGILVDDVAEFCW
jgi:hypothetical protein